jgi:hypothetical protein
MCHHIRNNHQSRHTGVGHYPGVGPAEAGIRGRLEVALRLLYEMTKK